MKELQVNKSSAPKKDKRYTSGGGHKWLIIGSVSIVVLWLVFAMAINSILMDRFIGRSLEVIPDTTQANQMFEQGGKYQKYNLYGDGSQGQAGSTATAGGTYGAGTGGYGTGTQQPQQQTQAAAAPAGFKPGKVEGTFYSSPLSGLSFKAPAGWQMQGYSPKNTKNGTITDMIASDGKSAVSVMYAPMKSTGCTTPKELERALEKNFEGKNITDRRITKNIGGSTYHGFVFMDSSNGQNLYTEMLISEANGYAVQVAIASPDKDQLAIALGCFS